MKEREDIVGLDILSRATAYLSRGFHVRMSREEAQANLNARVILFNCSNIIFKARGIGITYEEVEGARILERVQI